MPSRRISRRPFGPPILIGNIRLPPASTSTSAKLSHADDRANSEARLIQAQGLSIKPSIRTAFCTPSSGRASRASCARCPPLEFANRRSRSFHAMAKAQIIVENPSGGAGVPRRERADASGQSVSQECSTGISPAQAISFASTGL